MHESNYKLLDAFPSSVRGDAASVLSRLPENPHFVGCFSVNIERGILQLPNRVYHDLAQVRVSSFGVRGIQNELLSCLLTRHADGFARQEHLKHIIGLTHSWIPAYVMKLTGEYVIEILNDIESNLSRLDKSLYLTFIRDNPQFLAVTEQRIVSYWNCYYRHISKEKYVGFRLMSYFDSLK